MLDRSGPNPPIAKVRGKPARSCGLRGARRQSTMAAKPFSSLASRLLPAHPRPRCNVRDTDDRILYTVLTWWCRWYGHKPALCCGSVIRHRLQPCNARIILAPKPARSLRLNCACNCACILVLLRLNCTTLWDASVACDRYGFPPGSSNSVPGVLLAHPSLPIRIQRNIVCAIKTHDVEVIAIIVPSSQCRVSLPSNFRFPPGSKNAVPGAPRDPPFRLSIRWCHRPTDVGRHSNEWAACMVNILTILVLLRIDGIQVSNARRSPGTRRICNCIPSWLIVVVIAVASIVPAFQCYVSVHSILGFPPGSKKVVHGPLRGPPFRLNIRWCHGPSAVGRYSRECAASILSILISLVLSTIDVCLLCDYRSYPVSKSICLGPGAPLVLFWIIAVSIICRELWLIRIVACSI